MKNTLSRRKNLKIFEIYPIFAGVLLLSEILIEHFIQITYIGMSGYVQDVNILPVIRHIILMLLALALFYKKSGILIAALSMVNVVYMLFVLLQWLNIYDFIRAEAYIGLALVAVQYSTRFFKSDTIKALSIFPGILMIVSVVYKICDTGMITYLSECYMQVICDVMETVALVLMSIWYYKNFKGSVI